MLEHVVHLRGTGSGGCTAGVGAARSLPPVLWLLLAAKTSPAVMRSPGGASVGEPRAPWESPEKGLLPWGRL